MILLSACSQADMELQNPETEEGPSVRVPVTIELESAWNIDDDGATRAAPPGTGPGNAGGGGITDVVSDGWVYDASAMADLENVDKVRIVAFRRKDTSDGTGTTAPFLYDMRNDQTVDIIGWRTVDADHYPTSHNHRYATATLNKIFGYEYRVVAIAYNSTRAVPYASNASYNNVLTAGEHNWFTTNETDGLTLEDFMATIKTQLTQDNSTGWREYLTGNSGATGAAEHTGQLTARVMATPQLFWGYLHIGDNEPIIRFQTTDAGGDLVNDAPLTGLLYRGMAKIVLNINLEKRSRGGTNNNVDWLALMADHVMTQVKLSSYDDFLAPMTPVTDDGKFTSVAFITSASSGQKTIEAWMLPTRTRLAIRGSYIWALAHHVNNGQLCADNLSYGDMGTGIIASDVVDNYFVFRRNHRYVLTCSSSENIFNSHEID